MHLALKRLQSTKGTHVEDLFRSFLRLRWRTFKPRLRLHNPVLGQRDRTPPGKQYALPCCVGGTPRAKAPSPVESIANSVWKSETDAFPGER